MFEACMQSWNEQRFVFEKCHSSMCSTLQKTWDLNPAVSNCQRNQQQPSLIRKINGDQFEVITI